MDKETFCAQVIRHQEAMFRAAKAILKQDEDAEDAVQEAICAAFAARDGLRDVGKFKPWILRILKEILRIILFGNISPIHEQHTGSNLAGKAHLMSYNHHGHSIIGQFFHQLKNLSNHLRIQRGCRLIEKHYLRIHCKSASNRDTLLLSTGKLFRICLCLIWQTDTL